ncbi:DUF411 domain-containing protein [Roseospira navarrensis]|uniref:DUF411 domain-containing protein n=2 Tax=Roseospira navarrensis TaxID=140058 RepID=A0A7X1ZBI7_9PROT|nr:DUF411 domain-containing protein [Roseospira navarrensis]
MPLPRPRRTALALAAGLLIAPLAAHAESAAPAIEVYKSPSCGCCVVWADYMRDNGFAVTETDTEDLYGMKALAGIPDDAASCHTAVVDGYVIEGHVPAEDVRRLLEEKPQAVGLSVPGMPPSSPGMDVPGYEGAPFETLLVQRDGSTSVYARH